MKRETKGTMSYEERRRFAVGVLKGIAAPVTPGNVEFLLAWMSRENTAAKNNPLATTFPSDGWTAFNYQKKDGKFVLDENGDKIPLVKNYPSFNEGVRSTVVSLLGYSGGTLGVHDYSAVVEELRSGTTPEQVLSNSEAVEQIGTWGSFESRDGFGAEDTWGYTLEELEALAPGELEQLNTETLRPIKGYEFPDPVGSFAVEEVVLPEGADVEEWPDIQSGRDTEPRLNEFGEIDLSEEESRALRSALNIPGEDEYSGPLESDHDPRVAERVAAGDSLGETDLDREASYRLKQELAQAAFDEVRERLETETDYATRAALLQRYEELADELSLNEYGEYEMGEVQSEAFTDALLGAPNQYGELEMSEEDSAVTLEALLRMDLSDEERRFIREEMGNVSFWTQDRDDLMVTTPDGRRMNVIKWITEHKGQMPDDEILWWMNQTTYVQNNADGIRERDVAWFDAGPGVREQLLENPGKNGTGFGRSEILREAQKIGFNWLQDNPALLDKLAYDSYRFGWDGYDVKRALAGVNTFESADLARGTILANRQSVMDTAARYYMPVSAEGADDMAWDMYLGEETLDSVEAMYREQAKGQFPTLSGLIDQGVSMRAYFDPYKQRIGQLLEMSDVDLMNDARFQPIMFPGAGGGPMSLSEAQTFTRSLPEWQYTKNAEDAARSMADNVGRMMGVVA